MKKDIYNIINIAVLLFTAMCFILLYKNYNNIFKGSDFFSMLLLMVAVVLIHIIKAIRLYFSLFGTGIDFREYLKTYCKVTPVSIILPFKLGEFFRMFCYGKHIKNYLKGVIIVLMDRFMDTIALVSVMLLIWGLKGGSLTGITYFLLVFSILLLLLYYMFPRLYRFWKQYLLKARGTSRSLYILNMLENFQMIYIEISNVLSGRGLILYFLSLIAWGVEIGSVVIVNQHSNYTETNVLIAGYLSSALGENKSPYMSQFVYISVVALMVLYVILKISSDKKHLKEDNR